MERGRGKEGLPWWFSGKNKTKQKAANARDVHSVPVSGRSPGGGNGNPTPVFLTGKFKDREAQWATVHAWYCKQLDMT